MVRALKSALALSVLLGCGVGRLTAEDAAPASEEPPQIAAVRQRLNAIRNLAADGDRSALQALERLVKRMPVALRRRAEPLLSAYLSDRSASAEARRGVCLLLCRVLTEQSVPALGRALLDPDLTEIAIAALEPLPYRTVDQELLRAVDRVDTESASPLIGALGRRRSAAAVPALADLIQAEDDRVALAAAAALGSIGTEDADAALARARVPVDRRDAVAQARLACAEVLRVSGKPDAAATICRQLTAPAYPIELRRAAYLCMARALERQAPRIAISLLQADDTNLLPAAARIVRELSSTSAAERVAEALPQLRAEAQAAVVPALVDMPENAGTAVIEGLLATGPAPIRILLAGAVAERGMTSAGTALVAMTRNPDPRVRAAAAAALGKLQFAAGVEAIEACLRDPEPVVTEAAVTALASWPNAAPADAVLAFAGKAEGDVKTAALAAYLGMIARRTDMNPAERQERFDRAETVCATEQHRAMLTAARTQLRIEELTVETGKPVEVVDEGLKQGAAVYIDRDYAFTEIPEALSGATYLKLAMDDKAAGGKEYLRCRVNRPVRVYVAFDNRASSLAPWLEGWENTGWVIRTTDGGCTPKVYARDFPAGEIVLGGSAAPGCGSHYLVVVTPD